MFYENSAIKFGINQLDNDIHLQNNSLTLFKEDPSSNNHLIFLKILKSKNKNLKIFSDDYESLKIPKKIEKVEETNIRSPKIAWRYKFNDFIDNESLYDLTSIEEEAKCFDNNKFFENFICEDYKESFENLKIQTEDKEIEQDITKSEGAIFVSLFSPIFIEKFKNKNCSKKEIKEEITKKLFNLRKKAKTENICVFASIPCFLFEGYEINWELYFDIVFEFNSFEHYSGSIVMQRGGFYKYGFSIKSSGIEMEHLNTPPEENLSAVEENNLNDF